MIDQNTGIVVFQENLTFGIVCVSRPRTNRGCFLPQAQFSELQNALENVVIELRVVKDAHNRRELLHRMLKLIVEADTILKEQPLTKSALAGASD